MKPKKRPGTMRRALEIGRASARANLVPMTVLWLLAVLVKVAYDVLPPVHASFEALRVWQTEAGWIGPFANRVFFCGLLPGVFLWAIRSIRPPHPWRIIGLESVRCGLMGIAGDAFYRMLSLCFGDGTDVVTVGVKTLLDQFVWTVLFISPVNAVFYFWLGRDCSLTRTRSEWPERFYGELVAPNLLANWIVWLPVQIIVFLFPLDLQIHVGGLICTFWILMCLQIGRRTSSSRRA